MTLASVISLFHFNSLLRLFGITLFLVALSHFFEHDDLFSIKHSPLDYNANGALFCIVVCSFHSVAHRCGQCMTS